jgi:CRP-like cAMP-binding protein
VTEDELPLPGALAACTVLDGVDPTLLAALSGHFRRREHAAGDTIMREGVLDPTLRVVAHGRVRVLKRAANGESFPLKEMGVGESLGEMKLVDYQPNSAEVVAVEPTVTWDLDLRVVLEGGPLEEARGALVANIARQLATRLRQTSEVTAEALRSELEQSRARLSVASFIVNMFVIMAAYSLSLSAVQLLAPEYRPSRTVHSAVVIFAAVIPVYIMIRRSPYPLSSYGLTLDRWRGVLWESFLFSSPFMVLILLVKWAWISLDPRLSSEPLFNVGAMFGSKPFDAGYYAFAVAIYVLFSPIQELFARSGLQGSLEKFLDAPARGANWRAILLSNLMFASAHTHIGFYFCLTAFIPGLLWGWLYDRQRSLLGATLSHVLVGGWALFVVGVQTLIVRTG